MRDARESVSLPRAAALAPRLVAGPFARLTCANAFGDSQADGPRVSTTTAAPWDPTALSRPSRCARLAFGKLMWVNS